jgi:3-hydroxybutyryl-CoA dehydrogenase
MEIQKVGVLGLGLMGSGIAQVCAQAGFPTAIVEVDQKLVDRGLGMIRKNLGRLQEKGTLTAAQREAAEALLKPSTELSAFADCDIVIEAIVENLAKKREVYALLDVEVQPNAIFASNTSSLSITEMMTATSRAPRFIGMHFFNPVPVMKLVEVVRTIATDATVFESAMAFAGKLGKTAVRTSDRGGFIVNRLLVPYMLDAIRAFEEGAGSITDIDNGMKLGCGHPMGPFTLLDFVGLDTTYYIANIMFDEFHEQRFAAPPLLKRLVMAGWYGRKSGRGFYDYSDGATPRPLDGMLR